MSEHESDTQDSCAGPYHERAADELQHDLTQLIQIYLEDCEPAEIEMILQQEAQQMRAARGMTDD